MRLLVLGGTVFLGDAIVRDALARGWRVTTFSRGRSGEALAGAETLRGDRSEPAELDRLRGRSWDGVIDTSGFIPAVVGRSARLLAEQVPVYAFVSSISVYPDALAESVNEQARTYDCPSDATGGEYGELKAGCERAVTEIYGDRVLLPRPGLILGPRENIGRLPWWLRRIAAGGDVLAPGRPQRPLQYVDVRDLAAWLLNAIRDGLTGPVNLVSEPGHATMGELLEACLRCTGSNAQLRWTPEELLVQYFIEPWTELPCWVPELAPTMLGHLAAGVERAMATGLRCRPVTETVEDTWAWLQAGGVPVPRPGLPPTGLPPEKEQAVLAALATPAD
jgi:2'-hydroxyisoflavone reductase